jgi:hypothetical protein
LRKSYIFVYNSGFGSEEQIIKILDSIPEITNWRLELPNTFFLVSELSANNLSQKIKSRVKGDYRFIISELLNNKQGWLSKKTWALINKKLDPD